MRTYSEILRDIDQARSIDDADSLLRLASELDEHGTPGTDALAYSTRGWAYTLRGDHTMALECFQRALPLLDSPRDRIRAAAVIGSIGMVYTDMSDFPASLEHHHRALAIYEEESNRKSIAAVMLNIGKVQYGTGDYPSALEQLHRALALYEELGDRSGMALVTGNIGAVHASTGDHAAALEHYLRALEIWKELGGRGSLASITGNIGNVHLSTGDYPAALEHFYRALALHEEVGNLYGVAGYTVNILGVHLATGSDSEAVRLLTVLDAMDIKDAGIRVEREQHRATLQSRAGDLEAAHESLQQALAEAREHGLRAHAAETQKRLRELAQKRNDFVGYIEHNNEYTRITEEINGKETATKLAMQVKQREIDAVQREHQKQLAVLHSTLPKEVAERVARGEVVNDHYDNAAVIFLDIVGFTEFSSSMSSQEVIALLDNIFTQCDAICEQYNVTKIKTIGDSYMCVSFDSVINAALCALDMSRIRPSHEVLFRIGMHCGPVTAGVIGTQRMQYDVWGDTVNVASRMESAGEPGRVHVSEAFALNLKSNQESRVKNPISESHEVSHEVSHAVSHEVSHEVSHAVSHEVSHAVPLVTIERGSIDIKGKGLMQTYWLESTQP